MKFTEKKLHYRAVNSPCVLVVDDQPLMLEVIQHILSTLSLQLYLADSAEAALPLLEQHQFAAIICDYQLPGEDGIGFLAKAKAIQPKALLILITASTDLAILRAAINIARVEHFLQKPVDPIQLLNLMTTLST